MNETLMALAIFIGPLPTPELCEKNYRTCLRQVLPGFALYCGKTYIRCAHPERAE